MPVFTCNACNKEFEEESQQKLHYRSEWHRYNLKRKGGRSSSALDLLLSPTSSSSHPLSDPGNISSSQLSCLPSRSSVSLPWYNWPSAVKPHAVRPPIYHRSQIRQPTSFFLSKDPGVPGVTEALFQARQSALAEEHSKLRAAPMLYSCSLCGKEYRSPKAHAQHLNSRIHIMKASQASGLPTAGVTIIKPLKSRTSSQQTVLPEIQKNVEDEESEDEWVEVDPNEDLDMAAESPNDMHVGEHMSLSGSDKSDDIDDDEEVDASCCFICDIKHKTIENCMIHMHKRHGFFIPDVEYLKDPEGLLTYVGLKVKRDFLCLYCNDRCQPFQSLEAVRKHMVAKGHCKIRYGDGGDDEEAEFEEFYDYSSSYVDEDGKQLVTSEDTGNFELGSAGAELIITRKTDSRTTVRTIGSREFLRYYRQKPRPSAANEIAVSLASRYRNMGLATVQSREHMVRMKVIREMNRRGVDAMRSKMGMKSNVIRNLPKNVTH
ncbi:cytoplasmic 60S subunit biogenesis factor REI1-like protein 1 [Iris pallida]|uniref:Cytoplasmic 60S subunit biogenesis factor REI1-like protein 1 n=1 Tax=Iris pallida TaxID=29817 RepID=A0AAX6E8F5_IRIPA|nr:cytoplasmic 60S subunit biogenesis factor REI1-like protein 1 [Iris pallida]